MQSSSTTPRSVSAPRSLQRAAPVLAYLYNVALAVGLALLLRGCVFEAFHIPTGSMLPTLEIGDQIFVCKFSYGLRIPFTNHYVLRFGLPQRGDVVVFRAPHAPHDDYIKRVIALPGDTVRLEDGRVYLNGSALPQEDLPAMRVWDRQLSTKEWRPLQVVAYQEQVAEHPYTILEDPRILQRDSFTLRVPEGEVFVLGDNRDHSFDSRGWGTLPVNRVVGRALVIWWSYGHEGLRWWRLGQRVQ